MCLGQAENTTGSSKLDDGSSYSKVQQTRVFLPLCPGKLCGTFWLQQSNYQLFAHLTLMNQLNETSVSVGGVKVCHSAVCKLRLL